MEHPSNDGWSICNLLSTLLRACSVPNSTGEFWEVSQASCSVCCRWERADEKSSLCRKKKPSFSEWQARAQQLQQHAVPGAESLSPPGRMLSPDSCLSFGSPWYCSCLSCQRGRSQLSWGSRDWHGRMGLTQIAGPAGAQGFAHSKSPSTGPHGALGPPGTLLTQSSTWGMKPSLTRGRMLATASSAFLGLPRLQPGDECSLLRRGLPAALQTAKSLSADPRKTSATTLQSPHTTATLLQERM